SDPSLRKPSAWEQRPDLKSFIQTTEAVLFRPGRFFRALAVQRAAHAFGFSLIHIALASLLLGWAVLLHVKWYTTMAVSARSITWWPFLIGFPFSVFGFLKLGTAIAG